LRAGFIIQLDIDICVDIAYYIYMRSWSERQVVELFQLLFLRQLGSRVDKGFLVLKGGCNLRFFFKSIRYSEDLDLDIRTMARETLRKNVNQILQSPAFAQILRAHRLSITHASDAKQSGTTQRWKLGIRSEETGLEMPTRIEFSRRRLDKGILFEPVDPEVIHAYRLSPLLISHYSRETAFAHKVEVLAHRRETQARDVFDLKVLLDAGVQPEHVAQTVRTDLDQACRNAMTLRFRDFKGQVVAFLAPEFQEFYSSMDAWRALQDAVVQKLRELMP